MTVDVTIPAAVARFGLAFLTCDELWQVVTREQVVVDLQRLCARAAGIDHDLRGWPERPPLLRATPLVLVTEGGRVIMAYRERRHEWRALWCRLDASRSAVVELGVEVDDRRCDRLDPVRRVVLVEEGSVEVQLWFRRAGREWGAGACPDGDSGDWRGALHVARRRGPWRSLTHESLRERHTTERLPTAAAVFGELVRKLPGRWRWPLGHRPLLGLPD